MIGFHEGKDSIKDVILEKIELVSEKFLRLFRSDGDKNVQGFRVTFLVYQENTCSGKAGLSMMS